MSKTYILDGFAHFVAAPDPLQKLVSVYLKHEFMPPRPFLVWSTTLGLKLMLTILLETSMHFYIAFDDS